MYSNKPPAKHAIDARELIIFGTQDLAQLAHYYFRLDYPEINILAHTVDRAFLRETTFAGVPVVPFEELAKVYSPERVHLFIPLVHTKMGRLREEKYAAAKKMGYRLVNYISPRATVYAGTVKGDNNFIFEDNTVQPFVEIGSNNVLWSGNHIGHHTRIGDHCFLTSHVVVSGHVEIGNYCYLGVNSTIRDAVKLAERTLVGMGATIGKDSVPGGVYSDPSTKPREGVISDDVL